MTGHIACHCKKGYEMKDHVLYVRTTGADYERLLNALDALDYHWLSGQHAADPPAFFKILDENTQGVRVLNMDSRTIAFYPVEVLSAAERAQTLLHCRSVEQALSLLERFHHVKLNEELLPRRVGNMQSQASRDFEQTLRSLIYEEFQIDIVQLVNTDDKNLIYIKQRAGKNDVICKNMPQLYQQYLNNAMTLEQFAHEVGSRYQYAIMDAIMEARQLEHEEPAELEL